MQKIYYCTIYYLLPGIISTPANKDIRAQMYIQIVQRTVEIYWQIAKDHNSLETIKKKMVSIKNLPFSKEYTVLWKWTVGGTL